MHDRTTEQQQNAGNHPSWHQVRGRGSTGEVEKIYEVGLADGRRQEQDRMQAMMNNKFEQNLERSARFALRILEVMEQIGFSVRSVRMSTDGIFYFDILLVVDMDSFLSKEFLKVYEEVAKIEEEMAEETFNPHTQFLSIENEMWNEEAMIGDGYTYTLKRYAEA